MGAAGREFMMGWEREACRDPDYLNWLAVTSPTQASKGEAMDIRQAFPSKYIAAADLAGRHIQVTVRDVTMEKMGDDFKPVLWFQGKDKGLTINKTKMAAMVDAFGPETDHWRGQRVSLRPMRTQYQGKMVDAIELTPLAQAVAPAAPPAQQYTPSPQQQYAPPPPSPTQAAHAQGFVDDDVPF